MDQKIKRIILCLYAVGALKIISIIYFLNVRLQTLREMSQYDLAFSSSQFFGFDLVLDAFTLVLLFKSTQGLKSQKATAWAYAVAACVVTAPGLALPASIYTLTLLFNEDVRSYFINELEEKLKF